MQKRGQIWRENKFKREVFLVFKYFYEKGELVL
ncbi:hypothetical protein AB751O23_AA_00170 [Chlamydiales bacterium SCGC AB-751-O23]|nr:hypothetical protein AB751O23_AA_00170 [Chlamydiales bacterium SCGC AB-751-O23]